MEMLNKQIFDAMTIKLTAEDIPLEIPKLDPTYRRAPKEFLNFLTMIEN